MRGSHGSSPPRLKKIVASCFTKPGPPPSTGYHKMRLGHDPTPQYIRVARMSLASPDIQTGPRLAGSRPGPARPVGWPRPCPALAATAGPCIGLPSRHLLSFPAGRASLIHAKRRAVGLSFLGLAGVSVVGLARPPSLNWGTAAAGPHQRSLGRGGRQQSVATSSAPCRPARASWRPQAGSLEACRWGLAAPSDAAQPTPRRLEARSPYGPALPCWAADPSARCPSCNPAAPVPGTRRVRSVPLPRRLPASFPLRWVALRLSRNGGSAGGTTGRGVCAACFLGGDCARGGSAAWAVGPGRGRAASSHPHPARPTDRPTDART